MMISASGERRYPQARGKVIRKSLRGEENLSQPGTLLLVIRWTITLSFHPAIINNSPFVEERVEEDTRGAIFPWISVSCADKEDTGKWTAQSTLDKGAATTNGPVEIKELSVSNVIDNLLSDNNNDYKMLYDVSDYKQGDQLSSVNGRLKQHLGFWKDIGANEYILSVIEHGYRIPFVTTPPNANIKNNRSAFDNADFVSEAIKELIDSKSVIKVNKKPSVVNPLTVSVNAKGKKRLVLDLRHVNPHIWREKIKFDDWKIAQLYITENCYMFGFDLKSGYHHIDIDERYYEYLGFEWLYEGKSQYFVFTVLPFGLSSAGHIFTKTVRCLISHWRGQSIKILAYLDDGLCALEWSKIVRSDLEKSGFVENIEKSEWFPRQDLIFLGIGVNTVNNVLYIPESKKERIISAVNKAISSRAATARQLASVTGKIISIGLVLGNVTQLMTKYLHMCIMSRTSWDSYFSLSVNELTELHFWKRNLPVMGVRPLINVSETSRVVYSDASSLACGGYTVGVGNSVCHKSWSDQERVKSSTWRELRCSYSFVFNITLVER